MTKFYCFNRRRIPPDCTTLEYVIQYRLHITGIQNEQLCVINNILLLQKRMFGGHSKYIAKIVMKGYRQKGDTFVD